MSKKKNILKIVSVIEYAGAERYCCNGVLFVLYIDLSVFVLAVRRFFAVLALLEEI